MENGMVYANTLDDFPAVTTIDGINIREAVERQIPQAVVAEGNDESDWVHCPRCNEIIGDVENVYEYRMDMVYQYCPACGQKLKW